MKPAEFTRQFLGDVYKGCSGDVVLVSALRPFHCEVVPVKNLDKKRIDFDRELFFSVASYAPGVIQTTGKGRNKASLSAVGILHFDFDKKKFESKDAAAYFKTKGLSAPSYVLRRADRCHVYYLLAEPCRDFAAYEALLKRLTKQVGADPLPSHPAALMRVPYTAHRKKGKTGPGYQVVSSSRKRYALSEFGPVEKSLDTEKAPSPVPRAGIENILLKERAPITSGGGRSGALYQFALRCRDFGIEEREALGYTVKFNTLYCSPPEPETVVKHQVTSAYKYAKHPPGRYLTEKPERMAAKFEADSQIAERLTGFVYVAEAEILINTETGLRYTKDTQIEKALAYATGVKTNLIYVLTFRLVTLRDRLAFEPEQEPEFTKAGITYRNTFEAVQPVEKTKTRKSDVKIFEDHLRYLANTEEEFEHLRKFIATALLRPGRKIKHALLLISTFEGIGKSVLQSLSERILVSTRRTPYVVSTSNTEIARGNNSWIESKFLTFVHELGQSEKFAVLDQIKNWITEPRVRISDKYIRSYEIENHCNFMFFSNNVNALPVGTHDRRFFVIVNRKKPMSPDYYETLLRTFDEGLYSIVEYLEKYADALNVNAAPPETESKREMRAYSKNELTLFLDEAHHDAGLKDFFRSGFTIRSLAERLQDSARAANVRFSQKQAAMWLRENNYYMHEKKVEGKHLREYTKDNVVRKADRFKEGKK